MSDPSENDSDEMPRPYTKRRKTFQDWITTVGGMVAIVGAAGAGIGFILGVLPFVRTDVYATDKIMFEQRVDAIDTMAKQSAADLTDIKRTSLLSLQLQLRTRIDLITTAMSQMNKSLPAYPGLQVELNVTQQQFDEITRQLNR